MRPLFKIPPNKIKLLRKKRFFKEKSKRENKMFEKLLIQQSRVSKSGKNQQRS